MNTLAAKPYWYITPSLQGIVCGLGAALAPQVLLLCVEENTSALLVIAAAIAASVTAEILSVIVFRVEKRRLLAACVRGCIAGMLFPQSYPVFSVYLITLCAFLLTKYFPGSLSGSWINAAALAAAAAYFVGADFFPLPQAPVLAHDSGVTSFLNARIFKFTGTTIPEGYISLLWDSHSLIPAFRFNALILVSSLFLISLNMINWVVPATFLAVYLLLVRVFGGPVLGELLGQGNVLFALFSEGTLFTAFFLLAWFGTCPLSVRGKALYGVCAGIIAFIGSGTGVCAACTVLAANLASVIIQFNETKHSSRVLAKKLIPQIKDVWRLPND